MLDVVAQPKIDVNPVKKVGGHAVVTRLKCKLGAYENLESFS